MADGEQIVIALATVNIMIFAISKQETVQVAVKTIMEGLIAKWVTIQITNRE